MMASQGSKISTFVFLDLETTGLLNAREKTRVTECSLVAVHRTQLLEAFRNRLSSPARVLNKLTLCFYPMKPIPHNIWQLTGLDNDNLYHQMNFTGATTEMFNAFLARLDPPVCLFAHNGDAFDFPLLKTEIENSGHSLAQGILCVDTLKMLMTIYGRGGYDRVGSQTSATEPSTNEVDDPHDQVQKNGVDISTPPRSFSLGAVFEHVFGHSQVNTHTAEGDCMSLLMICQKMAPLVCVLADENAVPFSRFSAVYS